MVKANSQLKKRDAPFYLNDKDIETDYENRIISIKIKNVPTIQTVHFPFKSRTSTLRAHLYIGGLSSVRFKSIPFANHHGQIVESLYDKVFFFY